MGNVSIPALIKEAIFLNDTLSDPEIRLSEGKDKERAVFHVKAFLEKASPYMSSNELRPSLDKLRETCSLMKLGESDLKIQMFVNPILKLPDEMLSTVVGFLNPKEFHKVAVTSNPSRPSLSKISDTEKLIMISSGARVRDLGLTEKSLLELIRRNEGIKIQCLNLDGVIITEIHVLLDLCPEVHRLSAVNSGFNSNLASQITSYENIRELNLGFDQIGDEGVEHISKMRGLTSLSLGHSGLGDISVNHISKMHGLKSLTLKYNPTIGDLGAELISKMPGLTSLNLSFNQIGPEGAQHISKMRELTKLTLLDSYIGASFREEIRQKFEARGVEVFL